MSTYSPTIFQERLRNASRLFLAMAITSSDLSLFSRRNSNARRNTLALNAPHRPRSPEVTKTSTRSSGRCASSGNCSGFSMRDIAERSTSRISLA